jgi:TP901 family phage tail tape measure protein
MATDLPGIRARAEFDLALFRQQEQIIKDALKNIATEMRAVPAARITIDTRTAKTAANEASRLAEEMHRSMVRDAQKATDALNKAARAAADAEIREVQRSNREQSRLFDQRLRERDQQRRKEAADAARAERDQVGEQRRTARADIPVALAFGGTGVAIADQLRDATGAAADFEKAMSAVRSVLSPRELTESGDALRQLALGNTQLGFTAVQAATALEEMSKAGISIKDQLTGLPAILNLAAAGNVTVGQAAEFAATAIQTFGLEGKDLERVSNTLVGVANATTTDIDKLRLSFSQTAAVAALQNQSIEQTSQALGLMAQAGIRSADAGTSLRVMLLRLQPETEKQTAFMQRYGLIQNGVNRFIDESTGKFRELSEVAGILNESFRDASDAQKEFALRTIFGQDAVRAAVVLTKAGAEGFANLAREMNEQGDAAGVARTRLDNLRGDMQKLNAEWNKAQILFAQPLEADFRGPVQSITALLQAVQKIPPEVKETILVIAAATAAFATVTGAVLAAQAAWGIAGVTLGALTASILAVAVPVAAVTAAIVALGVAWANNWGDIQGKTQEVVSTVSELIKHVTGDIQALHDILGRPLKFGAEARQNDPALDFFKAIVDKAKEFGEKSGIEWGEAFKRTLIAQIPGGAGALLIDDFLKPRRDAAAATAQGKAQEEAQKALTQEDIDSDRQRIAETILQQKPEIRQALVDAFAEGFKAVQENAERSGGGGVAGRIFAEQFREQVKANFPGASEDIVNTLVTALSLAGQDKITPAAEEMAAKFKSPWERAIASLTASNEKFDLALQRLGGDTDAIKVLLDMEQAAKQAEAGYKNLTDRGLVSFLVAKQNEIKTMELGEERYKAQIALGEEYTAHLAAQKKTEEDAAKAVKLADDIRKTGAELFEQRARSLISATYPALTAAERELVETKLKEGQAWQAAQLAIATVGGDLSKLPAIMSGTEAGTAKYVEQLKRLAEVADPAANAINITDDRARKFLQGLIENLPAATRAQIELTSATLGPAAAIQQAYNAVGLSIGQIPDFASASEEQVKKLNEQFREFVRVADPASNAINITDERARKFLAGLIENLPAATKAQIELTAATLGPAAAIQQAYNAVGLALEKIPDFANASSDEIKSLNDQFKEFVRTSDQVANAFTITRDRAKDFLGEIISDMPAAQRAQIEMVSSVEGPIDGLAEAYLQLGVKIGQIPDFANAGTEALKRASSEIKAIKFFQETGKLLPATEVSDAGKEYADAAKKAREELTKAHDEITKELQRARKDWAKAVQDAANELNNAEKTYNKEVGKIDSDLEKENASIDAAMEEARKNAFDALGQLDRQESDLRTQFAVDQAQRARDFIQTLQDQQRELAKTLDDINVQITKTVFDATRQQREQLSQLAAQLADLRSQEADTARGASIQINDLAFKELVATTAEERSKLAEERIRLQAEQGAAAVALNKQIVRGQAQMHQTTEDASIQLLGQIAELQRSANTAIQDFLVGQQRAREDFFNAQALAQWQFEKQVEALDRQREETLAALRDQLAALEKRRAEAKKQAEEAKKKAQEALDEARQHHQEAIDKAQEQLNAAIELAAQAEASAQSKFVDQMSVARAHLQAAIQMVSMLGQNTEILAQVLARNGIEQKYEFNNLVLQETAVDFLEVSVEAVEEELRARVVG